MLYVWFVGALAGRHLRVLAKWAAARGGATSPQTA
jgi:hypothetical protein